jgi:hypothetical protein
MLGRPRFLDRLRWISRFQTRATMKSLGAYRRRRACQHAELVLVSGAAAVACASVPRIPDELEADARCIAGASSMTHGADGPAVVTSEGDGGTVPDDCAGVIVDDFSGCLQHDAFCTLLSDGRDCTGSATPQCPPNHTPIAKSDTCPARTRCFDYSESLRCSIRLYTPAECAAAGGVGLVD